MKDCGPPFWYPYLSRGLHFVESLHGCSYLPDRLFLLTCAGASLLYVLRGHAHRLVSVKGDKPYVLKEG